VDAPLRQLGQRIQALRKARGWSQEKFADVCGVHRTYMGHIERGEKNVSFNTLVRLADALGITVSELLSDETKAAQKHSRPRMKIKPTVSSDDLSGVIRELNQQRQTLEKTAGALKNVANVLRTHERHSRKRKH
jgi:transcriptional regulator with XRE-family HTH domain